MKIDVDKRDSEAGLEVSCRNRFAGARHSACRGFLRVMPAHQATSLGSVPAAFIYRFEPDVFGRRIALESCAEAMMV
jgi:hypothetical protein